MWAPSSQSSLPNLFKRILLLIIVGYFYVKLLIETLPMSSTFKNESELLEFFQFVVAAHPSKRYLVRNRLLAWQPSVKAGVLVGFYYDSLHQLYRFILTQRTSHLRRHSNQICFPGGKQETTDACISETAIRETVEEIGIKRENIQSYGTLQALRTPTGYWVTPTLALIRETPQETSLNSKEVSHLLMPSCKLLLNDRSYRHHLPACKIPVPTVHIRYQNYLIWGLTAEILYFLALNYRRFSRFGS